MPLSSRQRSALTRGWRGSTSDLHVNSLLFDQEIYNLFHTHHQVVFQLYLLYPLYATMMLLHYW